MTQLNITDKLLSSNYGVNPVMNDNQRTMAILVKFFMICIFAASLVLVICKSSITILAKRMELMTCNPNAVFLVCVFDWTGYSFKMNTVIFLIVLTSMAA